MTEYLIYGEDGKYLGGARVMEQAVGAARGFAAREERPVDVVQVSDRSGSRRVRYYPDGSKEKLWQKKGKDHGEKR